MASSKDYARANQHDWNDMIFGLFEGKDPIPAHAMWSNNTDIIRVLNMIGQSKADNHLFFYRQGGLDLSGASTSAEVGCAELYFNGSDKSTDLVRPTRLSFESFGPEYIHWSYFRLEYERVEQTEVYESPCVRGVEELVEIEPGSTTYYSREVWDSGVFGHDSMGNELRLPSTARLVMRHVEPGVMAVFAKGGPYNHITEHYLDGPHGKSSDEFRKYVHGAIKFLEQKHGQSPVDWIDVMM